MAWEHLSINKPHLVYIILGGFTSIFMLVSLFIKEKLYIGEATVATICGVIFGPHAANLINPLDWGNTDQITLEFSRIVLVVQCFAVGVELPKAYMERHWRSVVFLLLPVMTFGWLICSLFIWWMVVPLSWLESLAVAACITATDPVLASSVVGKGKFAKRIPKHLRDLLSAESGCNDGMAFPFIYLSIYLIRYRPHADKVAFHWICYTILYECIFGAIYGVVVGYAGRRAIRYCEEKGIVDRESFLVFYFVLALFCAGSGSLLGMDDLLIGFCAGVGFSNDGWFSEKTEESHVSNVIDLLLNLTYFVYLGTIIPWAQYNSPEHGLEPWRLVVIAIFVIFFRRIPIMLACKPFIPDIKTWREALFAGHFGPIGVGAIFVAILARAELETESTDPLDDLPPPGSKDYDLIYLVWPIVTFLVIASIAVHGSSIAVFTLGKRINTMTITMSYTKDQEDGPSWMNRLPRISSQGRSLSRASSFSIDEEKGQMQIPKLQLRRQKEEEYDEKAEMKPAPAHTKPRRRKRKNANDSRLGGPVSASAIAPARRSDPALLQHTDTGFSGSDTLFDKSNSSPDTPLRSAETSPERGGPRDRNTSRSRSSSSRPVEVEAYDEGNELVVEDEEGNVISATDATGKTPEEKAAIVESARRKLKQDRSGEFTRHRGEAHSKETEGEHLAEEATSPAAAGDGDQYRTWAQRLGKWKGFGGGGAANEKNEEAVRKDMEKQQRKRGAAHAYQFGNTIIVEDEDGEVIKEYTLPEAEGGRKRTYGQDQLRSGMHRMGTYLGVGKKEEMAPPDGEAPTAPAIADKVDTDSAEKESDEAEQEPQPKQSKRPGLNVDDDDGLRLTISRRQEFGWSGQRRTSATGASSIALGGGRRLSTRDFLKEMQGLDPKKKIKEVEKSDAPEHVKEQLRQSARAEQAAGDALGVARTPASRADKGPGAGGDYFSMPTRPQAKRNTTKSTIEEESEDETSSNGDVETPAPGKTPAAVPERQIPHHDVRSAIARHGPRGPGARTAADARRERLSTITSNESGERNDDEQGETAAERRRRLAALHGGGDDSDESDGGSVRQVKSAVKEPSGDGPSRAPTVTWGGETGRDQPMKRTREAQPAKEGDAGRAEKEGYGMGGTAHRAGERLKSIWKR
jgi:sodium/hydrogen antiporter